MKWYKNILIFNLYLETIINYIDLDMLFIIKYYNIII